MKHVSVRIEDSDFDYLTTLQGANGASLSEVLRELIEQARQREKTAKPLSEEVRELIDKLKEREAAGPVCPLGYPGEAGDIHLVARYTASLVTGLAKRLLNTPLEAEELIDSAKEEAAPSGAKNSAATSDAEED